MFSNGTDNLRMVWRGRDGKALAPPIASGRYAAIRMSPDRSRAAVSVMDDSGARDIFAMELARGLLARLTTGTGNVPVWSPDGRRIAYHDSTTTRLETIGIDGDSPRQVWNSKSLVYVNDWSPDGQFIMYTETSRTTLNDLWLVPASGGGQPVSWLMTPFNESHGQFSPDGQWVAYTSNESGQEDQQVLTLTPGSRDGEESLLTVIVNWEAGLRK